MMKRLIRFLILISCIVTLASCSSDSDKAKQFAEDFMTAMSKNQDAYKDYYAEFSKLDVSLPHGTYNVEDAETNADTLIVSGNYTANGKTPVQLKFFILKNETGEFSIKDSYGFMDFRDNEKLLKFAKGCGAYKSDQFLAENWDNVQNFYDSYLTPANLSKIIEIKHKGERMELRQTSTFEEPIRYIIGNLSVRNTLKAEIDVITISAHFITHGTHPGMTSSEDPYVLDASGQKDVNLKGHEIKEISVETEDPYLGSDNNITKIDVSYQISVPDDIKSVIMDNLELKGTEFDEYLKDKPSSAQNEEDICGDYPEASLRLLTDEDLVSKSKLDLKYMRNEIYARHGYIFKTKEMKEYFEHQPWYLGEHEDVSSLLTNIEKKNIALIQKYEKK